MTSAATAIGTTITATSCPVDSSPPPLLSLAFPEFCAVDNDVSVGPGREVCCCPYAVRVELDVGLAIVVPGPVEEEE